MNLQDVVMRCVQRVQTRARSSMSAMAASKLRDDSFLKELFNGRTKGHSNSNSNSNGSTHPHLHDDHDAILMTPDHGNLKSEFVAKMKQASLSTSANNPQEQRARSSMLRFAMNGVECLECEDDDSTVGVDGGFTKHQLDLLHRLISHTEQSEAHRMHAFYMVDLGDIVRQHRKWLKLLPLVYPNYAVKCNPDPMIISLLASLGCSFDCASENELQLLQRCGVDIGTPYRHSTSTFHDDDDDTLDSYDKVVFSHPCKHPLHLRYAAQHGVNLCTFDNEFELEKIHQFHPTCKALLRIQVDDSHSICQFNSKYGYNADRLCDVEHIFDMCRKFNIRLGGIMFHVGSGCQDENVYRTAIEKARHLFDIAHQRYDYSLTDMNVLDVGGGFPGVDDADHVQFPQIARVINDALEYYFQASPTDKNGYKFIAEPGRYYVAKSHSLICDIIAKKKSVHSVSISRSVAGEQKEEMRDRFMYYLNEGMYGSFNCIYFDHAVPNIVPYSRFKNRGNDSHASKPKYASTIFGPTCDSMDKMYDEYMLEEMHIMDKIVVPQFGAYTNAAASGFNGFAKSPSRYVMTL